MTNLLHNSLVLILFMAAFLLSSCANSEEKIPEELSQWTFTEDMFFPAGRPLMRPEDGVALTDGRLIVSDQAFGLREILADGTTRPFGQFSEAGYIHEPPNSSGGANGVTLEPDGTHLLVTDIHHGGIYRVDIENEETELLYQHAFGVNMARRDEMGGIWFSQSTRNPPEAGEARLFAALESPLADGAIHYLPPGSNYQAGSAIIIADSLYFANGIVLDEKTGHLYVAETMGHRVQRFRMDSESGRLTDRRVILEVLTPDNLEIDQKGRLWIVSALKSEIKTLDMKSGVTRSELQVSTPKSRELILEIERRLAVDESFLELFGPDLWEPAPGSFTGIILSPDGGPNYITNLGNALIRFEPHSGTEAFQERNPENVVPITDEPDHKIRFDNGRVRMYEVVLKQGESTLMHEHLADNFTVFFRTASILIEPYGDGEPVVFEAAPGIVGFSSTADGPYSHCVASAGEETFHVIAMELLTQPPANAAHPGPRSGSAFDLVMENNRGRAYRITLAPGESTGSFTRSSANALFAVSAGRISEIPEGKPSRLWDFDTADFRWFDAHETLSVRNEGSLPVELIEIEILTDNPSIDSSSANTEGSNFKDEAHIYAENLIPDPMTINLADVEWGEPGDGSIAPAGTRTALQSTDPATGGISYFAWFPAGGFFDLHWHTHDEYVVLISGTVTISLGEEVYDLEPGAFIVIPGGVHHYWDVPESGDAVIMVKRMGPPDFHFVNR